MFTPVTYNLTCSLFALVVPLIKFKKFTDFNSKRKRMSYAASFKLKAVEAKEKTSNVEAAKNLSG